MNHRIQAAEMVLVRLAGVADLPAPAHCSLGRGGGTGPRQRKPRQRRGHASNASCASPPCVAHLEKISPPAPRWKYVASHRRSSRRWHRARPRPDASSFGGNRVVEQRREALLRSHSGRMFVGFISNRDGLESVRLRAPRDLTGRLGQLLERMDGRRWLIAGSEAKESRCCASGRSASATLVNEVTNHRGSGGARDVSGGDNRRGSRAVRGGQAEGMRILEELEKKPIQEN